MLSSISPAVGVCHSKFENGRGTSDDSCVVEDCRLCGWDARPSYGCIGCTL